MKAEVAYRDWSSAPPTDRPLAAQRTVLAKILFEVLKAHDVSRLRFADMIGVNEKQVRKMLDGRSPVPMAVLGVMPIEMSIDFMDRVVQARGGGVHRAASLLHQGIEGLRADADRPAALRGALDAQRELLELTAELSR